MEPDSLFNQHIFWDRFLDIVKDQVNNQSFNTWFKPLGIVELSNDSLVISVPKPYYQSWLEEHYLSLLNSASQQLLDRIVSISFIVTGSNDDTDPPPVIETSQKAEPTQIKEKKSYFFEQQVINPRFNFDSFVIGNSNQFAHAASKAVAESPGKTSYNPLVIYGGVGLGKTHLLQSIANHCHNSNNGKKNRVIVVSSEKFTMDFIMSIQNNLTHQHSNYYRTSDVLLVDDIQFFNNKERTQEEFFHIFNVLHQSGKQIVLTMDRPPSQLKGLADRLINRFQWGLVTDIQPPDFETRVAILKKKAEVDGVFIENSIFDYIAENITSNIRELEGSLIRLLAYSSLRGQDICLDMAHRVLGEMFTKKTKPITIESIQKLVSDYFTIPNNLLMGNSRRREIAVARHIAIYLAKKLTDSSLKTIGLHFGGRDHSTVIHSINNVEKKYMKDPTLSKHIMHLTDQARNS
ncbi:MAG: chromosomal replication initiator protein DnaA [Candidatus Latescibacteria bacterium]|nr:chromosomal replication initiator protein DnaA [Candidatus Latescibacterota bacterium]